MAWSSTVDEKKGGGWTTLEAGDLDASNLLKSTLRQSGEAAHRLKNPF